MIHFACSCGQPFDFPESQAGDSLQCPKCMRLVDVPLLGEIGGLETDGTVRLAAAEHTPADLNAKLRTFAHRDDLRQNVDEYLAMDDLAPADEPPRKMPPRYDPETGDLLESIELQDDKVVIAPQDIPLAKPALNYSTANVIHAVPELHWWQVPYRILTGMSLMAMFFVFLLHVVIHLFLVIPGANFLLAPLTLLIAVAIAAHYCTVIEEFGPNHHDHVPVLLRRVSFSEDVVHPLLALLAGVLFAFGPTFLMLIIGAGPILRNYPWVLTSLLIAGAVVFPAAVMTASTSGAIQNMLPHHVLRVIRVAPFRYLLAWIPFAIGMIAYITAAAKMAFTGIAVLTAPAGAVPWGLILGGLALLYTLMLIGTYCLHLSSAWLGMIYRTHYQRFNWVYQQHDRKPRTDTIAQLEDMRRRGDPRLRRKVDPQRLQAAREAEAVRRENHTATMRKI